MSSTLLVRKLDHLGITVSVLCAVHCALMPVILTALPFIGLGFLTHPAIETAIILLSLSIGLTSVYRSWYQHHRYWPLIMMLTGFSLIASGHFLAAAQWEWVFLVVGSLLVSAAHFVNWRLLHQHCV